MMSAPKKWQMSDGEVAQARNRAGVVHKPARFEATRLLISLLRSLCRPFARAFHTSDSHL
eukprot:2129211-Pleurochrysis_carterae.AAC.1